MNVGCSTHAQIEGVQVELLEDMISSGPYLLYSVAVIALLNSQLTLQTHIQQEEA